MSDNENQAPDTGSPAAEPAPPEAAAAAPRDEAAEPATSSAPEPHAGAEPAASGDAPPEAPSGGDSESRPKKKRRRKKRGPGEGGEGGRPAPREHVPAPGGRGRSFVEDQIDRDAEKLARDARTIPAARLRPLGVMAQEVRRMAASGSPGDAREARRALVLMKSKVAFLAGREQGRERAAFVKVRDTIFSGVDALTRQRETPDPMQLRNFLDHLEAFVGYHRFHSDDRRRD